jgi:hypothetical protein
VRVARQQQPLGDAKSGVVGGDLVHNP